MIKLTWKQSEVIFENEKVIPYLIKEGHTILRVKAIVDPLLPQKAAIISSKNGVRYITEVKISANRQNLRTAIGQILLHQFAYRNYSNVKYQIAFPLEDKKTCGISDSLVKFFEERLYIVIIFIKRF